MDMNKLSKVGRALIIVGSLIFAWMAVSVFLHFAIHLSIPWYIQLAVTATMVTAFVLGAILMVLQALYSRYKTVKTEEVHEKV